MEYYKNGYQYKIVDGNVVSIKKISKKKFFNKNKVVSKKNNNPNIYYPKPVHGWGVDGSTLAPNPGLSEYRCLDLSSGDVIFNTKLGVATNNISEFLAIVQALIHSETIGISVDVYSDSMTAIAWVKNKRYNTMLNRDDNKHVFELMDECITWLQSHHRHNPVHLWHTKLWGQIPADFGRAH